MSEPIPPHQIQISPGVGAFGIGCLSTLGVLGAGFASWVVTLIVVGDMPLPRNAESWLAGTAFGSVCWVGLAEMSVGARLQKARAPAWDGELRSGAKMMAVASGCIVATVVQVGALVAACVVAAVSPHKQGQFGPSDEIISGSIAFVAITAVALFVASVAACGTLRGK